MANVGSPFTSSATAQRLPDIRLTGNAKLVIKLNDAAPTDKILFSTDPNQVVTAARADGYVVGGGLVEINCDSIRSASDVSIIAVSGTPAVYWGVL